MIKEATLEEKFGWLASLAILLFGVCGYIYTGNILMLGLPFVFLYILLVAVNWKTAYWVMLLSIPVSIDLYFSGNTLSTSAPDEPLMWGFLLLFPVLLASRRCTIERSWLRHPIVFLIALQFVWMMVAVFYSHMHLISVKFMIAKSWFLVSFFIIPVFIFREKKDFRIAFWLLLLPVLLTVCIIMVRHAALGFSFRQIEQAIGDLYFNHVDYSTIVSMIFPLALVAIPLSKGKSPVFRWTMVFIALFLLPAIYLTYARAALLAVLFAVVVGIAIRLKLTKIMMPVFYGAIALFMAFMIRDDKFMSLRPDYQHTFMHRDFSDHIIATFRGEDMSSMERLYRWIAAVRMSQDEPVKGFGPNTFYYYYKPYAVASFRTYVSRNFEHSTTHNYYLYLLVEQGWPAMIIYAIMIHVILVTAQRAYHRFKDRFYKYCLLGAAMMFGAGWVNNFFSDLIETHKVGAYFYLSIALIVILDRKSKQQEQENNEAVTPS